MCAERPRAELTRAAGLRDAGDDGDWLESSRGDHRVRGNGSQASLRERDCERRPGERPSTDDRRAWTLHARAAVAGRPLLARYATDLWCRRGAGARERAA